MVTQAPKLRKQTGHKVWVRISHWIITLSFFSLAFSGFIILMCHPRLYWGEVGNDLTPALFELPVSRNYKHGGWDSTTAFFDGKNSPVSASRTYDIFNQNGWGRSLHFLTAWILVITGVAYFITGFVSGHFRRHLLPAKKEMKATAFARDFVSHVKLQIPKATGSPHYGLIQKITYNSVIFFLLPLTILTGLTMSPAITAAFPFLLTIFFGAQSARTIHFFSSSLLVLFLIIHIVMLVLSGFKKQIYFMTIGKKYEQQQDH